MWDPDREAGCTLVVPSGEVKACGISSVADGGRDPGGADTSGVQQPACQLRLPGPLHGYPASHAPTPLQFRLTY